MTGSQASAKGMGSTLTVGASAFAITVAFELAGGAFAEFHRLVKENAALSVELEPGCLRFDVLIPATTDATEVWLYEIYSDRAAFDLHLASDHYRSFDTNTRDLVNKKTVLTFTVEENAKLRGTV